MPAGWEKPEPELSPLSAAAHSCQGQAGVAEGSRERRARVGTQLSCCLSVSCAVLVQAPSRVHPSATPRTAARQASLSFTVSWSPLKLMPTAWVMPSNHLIVCHPLLLLLSVFPSIYHVNPVGGKKKTTQTL